MLELAPPIVATAQLAPYFDALIFGEPALAQTAQPGQFVAVRMAHADSYDPVHRFGLPIAGIDRDANTITLLSPTTGGFRDRSNLRVGDTLNLLGPLGQGWLTEPRTRQLLLLGTVATVGSLLALAADGLRRQCAVTLILGGPIGPGLPAQLIPSAVEYHLGRGPDPAAVALELLDDASLRWADAIYTTLPAAAWPILANRIEQIRMRWERGFAQVAVDLTVPCAVGVCGVCELPVGRKAKLICINGPIFDLRDLTRG
ncbi:MAG: hypothetical protein H0X37_00980 [Herpetosiphonaceae bacterium]|nr:hypothetical protein [Herpetosiphonaceae bacterium]